MELEDLSRGVVRYDVGSFPGLILPWVTHFLSTAYSCWVGVNCFSRSLLLKLPQRFALGCDSYVSGTLRANYNPAQFPILMQLLLLLGARMVWTKQWGLAPRIKASTKPSRTYAFLL